jgi:hypothetical protein
MRRFPVVMRALDARIYPLRRPDDVRAPDRVDARNKSAHDETNIRR